MHQTVILNEHPIEESHKVLILKDPKIFYAESWIIPFSSKINKYVSPYYEHPNFKIIFALIFDEKETPKFYVKLVRQNSFDSINLYVRIGDLDGPNTSFIDKNVAFTSMKPSRCYNITEFKKSDIIENEWVNEHCKLTIYFEFFYNNSKHQLQRPIIQSAPPYGFGRIGLENTKSVCYMNSTLQILFHMPKIRDILFSYDSSTDKNKRVLRNLQFLFFTMERSSKPCSSMSLHDSIPFCRDTPNEHKDAGEFILVLNSSIQSEIGGSIQEKELNELFQISLISNIECKAFNYKRSLVEHHSFLNILIDKCQKDQKYQLFDLLVKFQEKSEIKDKTKEFGIQLAQKWEEYHVFPPILHITLSRFEYDSKTQEDRKIFTRVGFEETLDMSQFSGIENDVYDLYSVLIHSGCTKGGHYYSFIRDPEDGFWYKYDSSIAERDDIRRWKTDLFTLENAYMFYYVRRSEKEKLFCNVTINQNLKEFLLKVMERCRKRAEGESYLTFHCCLEDEFMNSSSVDDIKFIKEIKVLKFITRYELYDEVVKCFNKNVDEIRIWYFDKKSKQVDLIARSNSTNIQSIPNNAVLFVQPKKASENVLPYIYNDEFVNIFYIFIFIKYFDPRMKIPIKYIGTLCVEEYSQLGACQINSLLDFPENVKFHFFLETGSTSAKPISSTSTFKTAMITQGKCIIVQVDTDLTEDHQLPDLSKSSKFKDVEMLTEQEQIIQSNINGIPNHDEGKMLTEQEQIKPSDNDEGKMLNEQEQIKQSNINGIPNHDDGKKLTGQEQTKPSDNDEGIPNYNAIEILKGININLLHHYLALRYNMNHFIIYNYDDQEHPLFTLDFPASLTLKDLCEIIKIVKKYQSSDCIWIFDKLPDSDKATRAFIPDERFRSKAYSNAFPGNCIYYMYTPGITIFTNKMIYDVQIASDGYNIDFSTKIIGPKQTNAAELLLLASQKEGFPCIEIDDVIQKVAKKQELRSEETGPDKTNFVIYDVNEFLIYNMLMISEFIHLTYHTIRFCKYIPPEKDEVNVKVLHVRIKDSLGYSLNFRDNRGFSVKFRDNQNFDYIDYAFYINLKKNLSVGEFKQKVLKCVKIADESKFLKTKLKVSPQKEEDNKEYLVNDDDEINDLNSNSTIFIIYD